MRNVPRAPAIDATSRLKPNSFSLCRSGQLVERDVELQDVDTGGPYEAPRPADRVLTDELVHLVEADTPRLGDARCLQIRVGHRDVGIKTATAVGDSVRGDWVVGALARPVHQHDLTDAVVDTEGGARHGHAVVGGDEGLRRALLVDRHHALDRTGQSAVMDDRQHRTDTVARAVGPLVVDSFELANGFTLGAYRS